MSQHNFPTMTATDIDSVKNQLGAIRVIPKNETL